MPMKLNDFRYHRSIMLKTNRIRINQENNQSLILEFNFRVSQRSITLPFCITFSKDQDFMYKSECFQIDYRRSIVKLKDEK